MGFEPEMRRLVASPGMPPKEERQTLLFSATYPEDIQKYVVNYFNYLGADFCSPLVLLCNFFSRLDSHPFQLECDKNVLTIPNHTCVCH